MGRKATSIALQGLHFRGVLGVAGDVDPLVPEGDDVAVPGPLGMEGIPVRPLVGDVVGRHGFDGEAEDRCVSPLARMTAPGSFAAQAFEATITYPA